MTKRIFIIHGWEGFPGEAWFPWLKEQLESKGFEVHVPQMPHAEAPEINSWVTHVRKQVGTPDEETYFVGHSIGCQTILRYLETVPDQTKVGGCVFVAGFFNLTPESFPDPEDKATAKPWLETPIGFHRILQHTNKFIAIFSDNDPYVPISDLPIFQEKLNAETILKQGLGHMGNNDNVPELPSVLEAVLTLTQ